MAEAQPVKPAGKPKVTDVVTDHLKIRYENEVAATPDGSVSFVVQIEPRPGMHVYAPGAAGYQVINLAIDEHVRVRPRPLQYPASEIYHFQPLNEKIPVYEKSFTLRLDAVAQKAAEPLAVTGRLRYQACDDRVCFAPASVPLSWTVALGSSASTVFAQTTVVRDVRVAIGCTSYPCSPKADFSEGEAILARYRAANGDTSQALEALSWLGRAALAAGRLDQAQAYATDAYDRSVERSKARPIAGDVSLENALGAAIEVQAHVRAAQGRRSDAVYLLRRELETYRHTPLHLRIQKNINLLSLEGQAAPALAAGSELGRPTPSLASLKGHVVILFFWAHWCGDCKAQGPILSALLDRHRAAGVTIVAPTQHYGYTVPLAPATPAAELAYIGQVRNQYYAFLRDEAVPVSDANHKLYGVSTTPTLVVVDRQGIVRLYHPGTMTADELEAVIKPLLAAR